MELEEMEKMIRCGDGEKFMQFIKEKAEEKMKQMTAFESYKRLAHEIENQMNVLKEKEENRISVGNTLIKSLLKIKQTTSDLAQAIETEDISETLKGFSEEINKLVVGIAVIGDQINQTHKIYDDFWKEFTEWKALKQ